MGKHAIAVLREKEERENLKPLSTFLAPMDSYKGLKRMISVPMGKGEAMMVMKTDILVRRLRNHDCQKCEVRGLCKDAGGEECLLPCIAAEAIKNLESTLSQANEKLDNATRRVADLGREISKVRSEREYFRSRSNFFSEVAATSGRVITVEGYKAFRGTMRISPKGAAYAYELCGDWLYKPDTGCWYGKGRSFPADVCTILEVN